MAYIALYVGRKVSPTKTVNAQMGLCDEFAVETAINQIRNCRQHRKKIETVWSFTVGRIL